MNDEKVIAVFESYSQISLLQNEFKKRGMESEIIATPYKISFGCTKSILFYEKDISVIRSIIDIHRFICKGIFQKVLYKNKITYILM